MMYNAYGKPKTEAIKESIETRGSTLFTEMSYNNGTMVLDMVNHGRYSYSGIPIALWNQFKNASSYGHFYNQRIKYAYGYTKLR